MGSGRKDKYSNKNSNNSDNKTKRKRRNETSACGDASDSNSSCESGDDTRTHKDNETSPEKSVTGERLQHQQQQQRSVHKHKTNGVKTSSRSKSSSSGCEKRGHGILSHGSSPRTIKVENLKGRSWDLNYSLSNLTSTTDSSAMPPHTDQKTKKVHHNHQTTHHSHQSRDKSKERQKSEDKTDKRKIDKHEHKDTGKKDSKHKENAGAGVVPNCPLCVRPFKSPIVLTCAHTFCKACVTVLVEAGDGRSYQCPVCLTTSALTGNDEELFCPNFVILHMTEKGNHDNADYTCSICDKEREAKYYCKNCSDLLCDTCNDAHRVVKYTKDHTVSKLSSSSDLSKLVKKKYHCIQHEKEKLTMYCDTCRESICRECAFTQHVGGAHSCRSIEDAATINRDLMKRKLFDIKCRTPKFQLMLLDIKRLKGLLRNQVKSVRVGIGTSINNLIDALKEKEKDLCKHADKIFANKLKNLKDQKHQLERELEKHDALGRMLIQIDKHENDVEMLQMKEAIIKSLDILDKPSKLSVQCDKHTFLLRSNEVTITKEIEKHGEIYCANKDSGEINLLTEDVEGARKVSALGRLKRSSRTEDKIIMFTELEDGLLSGNYDGSMGYDGVLQDSEVVEAKELKAKANWMLLKSHLPNIVNYGKTIGRIPQQNDMRQHYVTKAKSEYRTSRRHAKKMKARANWLLTKARLKQIVRQKDPPPEPPPAVYKSKLEKQSVLQILRSGSDRYSRKLTRSTAIKARARANWLLVRSRLHQIVAFGRICGILQFQPRRLPLTPYAFRRKREAKVVSSVMHLRAKISRARANWLLVKSRLKDIAKYQPPQTLEKPAEKPTWGTMRNVLYDTRNHACQNIQESGAVRARANWLILKTLIPDIILFGKYREMKVREAEEEKRRKQGEGGIGGKAIPDYVLKKWDNLLDEGCREKKNWDILISPKKVKKGKKEEKGGNVRISSEAQEPISDAKEDITVAKDEPLSKAAADELLNHWDMLITYGSTDKEERHVKKKRIHEACRLWDVLLKVTEGKKDKRNKSIFERPASSSQTSSGTDEKANIQRKIASFKNWDKLISFLSTDNWSTLVNMTPGGDAVTDSYLSSCTPLSGNKEAARSPATVIKNWKILIEGTPSYEKTGPGISKSVESFAQAVADWDRIIKGTTICRMSLKSEPLKGWDKLCGTKYSDTGIENWGKLIGKTDDISPKNKTNESFDNWKRLTGKFKDDRTNDSYSESISNWRNLTGRGRDQHTNDSKQDESEALKQWDSICNTKYVDIGFENWKKLTSNCDNETQKDSKKDKSESISNWQKLTGKHKNDRPDDAKSDDSEPLNNWKRLTGKYKDEYQKESKNDKSETLKHWDSLSNTKYTDTGLKNWKKLVGKTDDQNSKGEPSESFNNWKKLLGKSKNDSPKESKNNKSEAISNWNKLCGKENDESYKAPKDKTETYKEWDKLSNTKYFESGVDDWGKLIGKYEDESSNHNKKTEEEPLDNWKRLIGKQKTRVGDSNKDETEALKNWDILTSDQTEKPSGSPSGNFHRKGVLKNWDKLCGTKYDADEFSTCGGHKNWDTLLRDEKEKSTKEDRQDYGNSDEENGHHSKYTDTEHAETGSLVRSLRSEGISNWDRLCKTKPTDDNIRKSSGVPNKPPRGKPRPKSAEFENWDKLLSHKKQEKEAQTKAPSQSPAANKGFTKKSRAKSVENLENWDRLIKTDDSHEERRSSHSSPREGDQYMNWDKLVKSRSEESEESNARMSKEKSRSHWDILCKDQDDIQNNLKNSRRRTKSADLENLDKLRRGAERTSISPKEKERAPSRFGIDKHGDNDENSDDNDAQEKSKKRKEMADLERKNVEKDRRESKENKLNAECNGEDDALQNWDSLMRGEIKEEKRAKGKNHSSSKSSASDRSTRFKDCGDNSFDGDNTYNGDKETLLKPPKGKPGKNWQKLLKGRIRYDRKQVRGVKDSRRKWSTSSLLTTSTTSSAEKMKKRQKYKQQKNRKRDTALKNWNVLLRGNIVRSSSKDDTVDEEVGQDRDVEEDAGEREAAALKMWDRLVAETETIVEYEEGSNRERALFYWDTLLSGRIVREKNDEESLNHWRVLCTIPTEDIAESVKINWDSVLLRGE